MSAELLRRAAEVLRERAEAATPGRWEHVDFADPEGQPLTSTGEQSTHMGCGSVITLNDELLGGDIAAPSGDCYPRSGYEPLGDMRWIATVDPTVGLALAAWLEVEAKREAHSLAEFGYRVVANEAHALARAVLRESDEGSAS